MADSPERPSSSTGAIELYQALTSLVIHAEQARWARLNTFLVAGSILVAAWVGLLVATTPIPYKRVLLLILCIAGFISGALWTRLGLRSSEYLDDFHDLARGVERTFAPELPRPFHLSEERRKTVRFGGEVFSSSKWLAAAIPFAFSVVFIVLAFFSWQVTS